MSATVSTASVTEAVSVQSVLTAGVPDVTVDASKRVTHSGFGSGTRTYTPAGTVPVTKAVSQVVTMTAGAATVDLTSLIGPGGGAESFSGLKLQVMQLYAPESNANPVTLEVGASNGYEFAGAAFSVTLSPGQRLLFEANDQAPDVSGSAKTFDLTGTGSQVLHMCLLAG